MTTMKKALLTMGIILVLVILLVMACACGSITGEYKIVKQLGYFSTEHRIVLTEGGTFYYKTSVISVILEEWNVRESGEWDSQGDSLFLQFDDYTIEATINGDKIIVGTNSKIPSGTWEKVE